MRQTSVMIRLIKSPWMMFAILPWFGAAAEAESPSTRQADSIVSFRVRSGEIILAPVEVFGQRYEFMLDTGATASTLDVAFRERLDPPVGKVVLKTPVGEKIVEKYAAPPMKIGQTDFQSPRYITCQDFSNVRSAYGSPIDGVLGMDFLQSRILQFHFEEGQVRFPAARPHDGDHAERIRFRHDCPCILLWIPVGGFQDFLIGTGSNGSVNLESKLFDALVAKGDILSRSDGTAAIVGENVVYESGILRCLKLGPHTLYNLSVSKASHNSIGMRFLARFVTTLDFPQRTAYFTPGKRFQLPEERDRSGLGIDRTEDKTVVYDVEPDSPAAQAGLQKQDVLLELDEVPVSSLRLSEIRTLFCRKDAKVRILFDRDGNHNDVALHLSNVPDPFPEELPRTAPKPFPDVDE